MKHCRTALVLVPMAVLLAACNDRPPTAADVQRALGVNHVDNLSCDKSPRGGYECRFLTASSGILGGYARFYKQNGIWKAAR